RNIYVGGSDVPTILGINKYKSQFELAKEKTGIQPSQFTGNEYTAFGNALEPQIRDYINAINDTHFIVDTTVNEEKHIRSNVDGVD
ncbi:YqaJ viral recombinase family protein, partial [Streptococcus oralis]